MTLFLKKLIYKLSSIIQDKHSWLSYPLAFGIFFFVKRNLNFLESLECIFLDEHKLIIVCLPKCGSRSLIEAFPKNAKDNLKNLVAKHTDYQLILPYRDGLSRLKSAYKDKIRSNFVLFRALHFIRTGIMIPKDLTFTEFAKKVLDQTLGFDKHWFSYKYLLSQLSIYQNDLKVIPFNEMQQFLNKIDGDLARYYVQRNKSKESILYEKLYDNDFSLDLSSLEP